MYVKLNMHYRCKGMRKRRTECGHMDVFGAVEYVYTRMRKHAAQTCPDRTYVYVCIHMWFLIRTYISMYIYVYVCVCVHLHIYTIHLHIQTCIPTLCMYICMYVRSFACMYVCIYIYTYDMYVCTCILPQGERKRKRDTERSHHRDCNYER